MESKFIRLRKELDDLGYTQMLKPDCVHLVDKLLSDLKTTTESLQKYMKIAKQAIEERDNLQLGAEPYKCDNAKLIKECNELQFAFIQFKEQHEKVQKDLKTKVVLLENQLENCQLEKQDLIKRIKDLQGELSTVGKKGTRKTGRGESLTKAGSTQKSKDFQLNSAMACADQKIAHLSREIKKLKDEHLELAENNNFFKSQLQNRDEEINRLKNLLEGGRPLEAMNRDCCYRNIDNKVGSLQDQLNTLKQEKNTLQNQLKEALAKQHEAMRRALHLAERNKQLEKEMKDIDQIALAVEAECNSTLKNNVEKVTRLQDRMNESVIVIQNLERENSKLRQDKLELSSDLDAIKLEKKHLQTLLDTEIEDKKRITDRINSFTIIEHDLNMEIDRLVRVTGEQKRRIAELECQITEEKIKSSSLEFPKPATVQTVQPDYQSDRCNCADEADLRKYSQEHLEATSKSKKTLPADKPTKSKPTSKKLVHKSTCKKSKKSDAKVAEDKSPPVMDRFSSQIGRCCCEAGSCVKHMKELLDKEMEFRQSQATLQIESLKEEKEYYMKEYHRLCDEMRTISGQDKPDKQRYEDLLKKIEDKNQVISDLQNEIKTLSNEKFTLLSRLETTQRGPSPELDAACQKPSCKRKIRELELLRTDLQYVENDNNLLKAKLKELQESTVFDQDRMKKAFQEMEEHIRKLENERRELVVNQCTSRSNLTQLEEEYNLVKEQLKATQTELNNQKANYNQLKNLHEQTDRALMDAQNQILRAEKELANIQSRMSTSHRESAAYEKEIAKLQSDVQIMKSQLTKIDKEKDELLNMVDEKTEKIDLLEEQLKDKRNTVTNLEMELKELKRKLGKVSDEAATQEQLLRSARQEIALLQKEYDNEKRLKESALLENRRLQNDLSSACCDCRDARKELEIAKRQVEDLKRQLQHYVAEVKRTEDLISQKELERSEILDQFKSLSQEANILESNNHTLENEATQSKVQLSVALDHASDLERKLDNQDAIIRSYEKQISDLTSQVASLEIQLKQGNSHYDRMATELQQMKDLCIRLDLEKDNLKRNLHDGEGQRGQMERSVDRLSRENEDLKRTLDKERNNLESLEKLLKDARQEVIEQRLLNQDMQSEMNKLKTKVAELQEQLTTTSEQLDLYQEKALDYSQQIKQLRREIANERFSRVREDDTKRSVPICLNSQELKTNLSPKKPCYKFYDKDSKTKPSQAKALSISSQNQSPKLEKRKGYDYYCKDIWSPHNRTNSDEIYKKRETGSYKRGQPILKKSNLKSDTHKVPIGSCSCIQCRPTGAGSRFMATYSRSHKPIKERAASCSDCQSRTSVDVPDLTYLECVQPPSDMDPQKLMQKTLNKCSSNPITISSCSSQTGSEAFKNMLTVEVPGMECCISSNKVIKSKPFSPGRNC